MAASGTVPQSEFLRKSPIPKSGVLMLSGFGIKVFVHAGHLMIVDGVGMERRKFRLPRVGHGLRRLVVIGSDGFVSLSALDWLARQHASFVMLERNGKVLATTGPVYPSDARLRRTQAMAHSSGAALLFAKELIDKKLAGQEQVARHRLLDSQTADTIAGFREELTNAESLKTVSVLESQAAAYYWSAYRTLPINFPRKDEHRIPDRWRSSGNRASALTGSPRRAVNPANAALNFLYSLLEAESRLALNAVGLDPGIGVLHVDTPNRDSLACDLMEAVRAHVDAYLVRWVTTETLKREWFIEQPDGACRISGELAAHLAETAPTWARAVAPIAEWMAQTLWAGVRKGKSEPVLATPLTQRRRSEGRGKEYVPSDKPPSHPSNICHGCGTRTRVGRNCPKCGREISRDKLIEFAKAGRIAAQRPEARRKHSDTLRQHHAAKRAWQSGSKPTWPDEIAYVREIQPRLASVTISTISSSLGVCESYAADIRAGRHRPHPRHWRALAELARVSPEASSRATDS